MNPMLCLLAALVALVAISSVQLTVEGGPVSETYFGVDPNDSEAVDRVQKELNAKKWKDLFGDVEIEDVMDFPDFDTADKTGSRPEIVLKAYLKKFLSMFATEDSNKAATGTEEKSNR